MLFGGIPGDYALSSQARWYKSGGAWVELKGLTIVHFSLSLNDLALQYLSHQAFCNHALILEPTHFSCSAMRGYYDAQYCLRRLT